MVHRHGEGLLRAEGEIVAKGLLAAVGEFRRRWDVGWSDLGEGAR